MTRLSFTLALVCLVSALSACRGSISREPPVHLNPNMDNQDKYKPYRASTFFKDGRAMRTPPVGTVPVGKLAEKSPTHLLRAGSRKVSSATEYHTGKSENVYMAGVPFELSQDDLERGKDRYGIYCTPCHGGAGYGDGTVADRARGKLMPTNFHAQPSECRPKAALMAELAAIEKLGSELLTGQTPQDVPGSDTNPAPGVADAEAKPEGAEVIPQATETPAWQNEAVLGKEAFANLEQVKALLADPYGGCSEGSICIANQSELASDARMQEGQCQRTLGYIYHVITNGVRSMKPYRHQIADPSDRWAVAAYVRALQLSQSSSQNSVIELLSRESSGVPETNSALKALQGGKAHIFTSNNSFVPAAGTDK